MIFGFVNVQDNHFLEILSVNLPFSYVLWVSLFYKILVHIRYDIQCLCMSVFVISGFLTSATSLLETLTPSQASGFTTGLHVSKYVNNCTLLQVSMPVILQ